MSTNTYTIGNYAFGGCKNISSVELPNTISSIASYYVSFNSCSNIKYITLPQYVCNSTVDKYFSSAKSSITDIHINEGVSSITKNLFQNCTNIISVYIPTTLSSIQLTSTTTTDTRENAFKVLNKLQKISIPNIIFEDNKKLSSTFYQYNNITDIEILSGVTEIPNLMFTRCERLSSISFSDDIRSIGEKSFTNCKSLKNIRLNNGI